MNALSLADSRNDVLSDILETGTVALPNGSAVKLHSAISESEGRFLQKLVRELDATVTLEIGLAYGISALFICDALKVRQGTQHIVIDPLQFGDRWGGIGMANLRRAGYAEIVRLIEKPSYRALAELEASGQRVDFAFIDGCHTFDFAFVDFFLVDRVLKVGGIVAFDDASWPAIRKVCRFVKNNLAYSVAGTDGPAETVSLKRRLSTQLLRHSPFRKLLKPELERPDLNIGLTGSCIAFRKDSDEGSKWDHFLDF